MKGRSWRVAKWMKEISEQENIGHKDTADESEDKSKLNIYL